MMVAVQMKNAMAKVWTGGMMVFNARFVKPSSQFGMNMMSLL